MLGDLGGITEIFLVTFEIFLTPIAEHSFILQVAKALFLARTAVNYIFKPPTEE
jgi:hypothetical protein